MACTHRKPRNITRPNGDASGNPHPDATAGKVAGVAEVLLTLQYTRTGLSGPTYKVQHSLSCPCYPFGVYNRPSSGKTPKCLCLCMHDECISLKASGAG